MGICEIICGDLGRSSVFILTAGGVVCSYFAMQSCEFFSYSSVDPEILPPPYFNITSGYVGLFNHYDYEKDGINSTSCSASYTDMFVVSNENYNVMFFIAQLASLIGPAAAALAFLFNLMEWFCCKMTVTFFVTFFLLFVGFVGQGLSFMIYGQTEFCFTDTATEDCSLEIGAYLSIAAASAFYLASVIWCCMPRAPPIMQRGRNKKNNDSKDRDLDIEEPAAAPAPPVDRDAIPRAEGDHTWQNYEKPSYRQENGADFNDEPTSPQDSTGSHHFQGGAMGGSANSSPMYQQQQQHETPSYHHQPSTSSHSQTSSQQQQQQSPFQQTVSEDDFANPFEDGVQVDNYERPTPTAYSKDHP